MITIVIPLYNKKDSIRSTIDSAMNQTYHDWEMIIVDDGSTDGSDTVVSGIADPRIRVIRKGNGGVSSARNVGIENARSEHIAFLDADDLWEPAYLEEIAHLIDDFPEAGTWGTSFSYLADGKLIPGTRNIPDGFYGLLDNSSWQHAYAYSTSSICCSRKAIREVGLFDERIALGEDMDMWWRIMLKYPAAYSNKALTIYRQDEQNRAMTRQFPFERHYIRYFDKYSEARKSNPEFRHFIDKECLWCIFPYYLEAPRNPVFKEILSQIDFKEYKLSHRLRFVFPKLYKRIKSIYKKCGSR